MAKTISIALQKGGVGKSTTAQALANILGAKRKKILLIDMDSQANTTFTSGVVNPKKTITDVLGEECSVNDAVIKCKYYDLLAADDYLSNVERADVSVTILKDSLKSVQNQYDYIIIDTPPALGNLSVSSLVASDYVVIPCEPRPYSLQGLSKLNDTIKSIQKSFNKNLKVAGILLIKYHNRTVLNRDIKDMIDAYANKMNTTLFKATIREGVAVAEAQTMQTPLIDYAKSSNPTIDYKGFTTELLKRMGDL